MSLTQAPYGYITALSLRAKRGNPVVKNGAERHFRRRAACDSHWIATSPATPRNDET